MLREVFSVSVGCCFSPGADLKNPRWCRGRSEKSKMAQGQIRKTQDGAERIWKSHDGTGVDLKKPWWRRGGSEKTMMVQRWIWKNQDMVLNSLLPFDRKKTQKQYYCLLFSIYLSPKVPVLYSTFFGFFFAVFSFACKEIIELTF